MSAKRSIVSRYEFCPPIHDHFDGAANCVQCGGDCRLEGAELAFTALLRYLFDGEAYGSGFLPAMAIAHLRRIGVDVDAFRKRANKGGAS